LLEELGDRPSLKLNVNNYAVDEIVQFINGLKENSSLKDLTVHDFGEFKPLFEVPSLEFSSSSDEVIRIADD
jgi:hypothetical protein